MTDCLLAHSDAAYVLGALSPADRLEFERHLPGCERCRRSVAELAGLPGLLGRVPVEQVEAPLPFEPLPATVLPALVAVVRREQRRKTVLVVLGAAAAIAVVALGVGALQAARDDGRVPEAAPPSSSPSLAPAQSMDVVHDYGMRADVSLTPVDLKGPSIVTLSTAGLASYISSVPNPQPVRGGCTTSSGSHARRTKATPTACVPALTGTVTVS